MKIIFGIFFVFLTFNLNAQTSGMERNRNYIPWDVVLSSNVFEKFENQIKTKNQIVLIAQKTEDTLNSIFVFSDIEKNTKSLYSIYIYNNTTDSLIIQRQDRSFYLIQEAKNKNGEWKPIEYWSYASCGNSYLTDKLEPKGIIETLSVDYDGDFATKIRFKLFNYDKVYYSNVLDGRINLMQFEFPSDFSNNRILSNIIRVGGEELLKKMIFLEPNSSSEFTEKNKIWLEGIISKQEKSKKN